MQSPSTPMTAQVHPLRTLCSLSRVDRAATSTNCGQAAKDDDRPHSRRQCPCRFYAELSNRGLTTEPRVRARIRVGPTVQGHPNWLPLRYGRRQDAAARSGGVIELTT